MVSPSTPQHQLETKDSQVQLVLAEIENKSFNGRLGEMGGIFHWLREMIHFCFSANLIPLGAAQSQEKREREKWEVQKQNCKSKAFSIFRTVPH